MAALFIIQARLSSEAEFKARYKQYQAAVQPLITAHGGRTLAIGRDLEVMEGGHDGRRLIILEFPDMEKLKAFWHSPEYARVKPLRENGGDAEAVLAEFAAAGVDDGALADRLQREGAASFDASWKDLLERLARKRLQLTQRDTSTNPAHDRESTSIQ